MQKTLIALLLALPLAGCQDSRPPRNYPPPASFQTRAERLDPHGPQAGYERRRAWRMAHRAQENLAVSGPRAVPAWNDKTLSASPRYPSAGFGPDSGPSLPPPQGHDAYLDEAPREFRRRGERRAFARADGPRAMLQRGRPSEDPVEPAMDLSPQSARDAGAPTDTPALSQRGRSGEEFEEPMADLPQRDARYARDSEETAYTAETAGPNARYARDSEEEDWRFGQAPGRGFRGGSRFAELPPGFQTVTLTHGGRERSYLIYAPPELRSELQNRQPVPLVLVFHGGGGNAAGIARTTNLHRVAEREGFIAVYPNGTGAQGGRRLSWNAGASPPQGYAEKQNVDDVGFVRTLLRQIQQTYPVDARRIYATGFSKGGMLTYRLACEMADQLAAIAPVGGTLTYAQCQPARPVALLHIHGSDDQSVPFAGGRGADSARMARYPSVLQNLDRWRQRNHCDAKPARARVTADTERYTYQDCKSGGDVSYYLVRDGGHAWPGSELKPRQQARGIRTSQQLKASEEIWSFFARHAKP